MTSPSTTSFVTDTATLCVFDLAALSHRLGDDADWWSVSSEALREVNAGNVAFVDLGTDGLYEVRFLAAPEMPVGVQVHLSFPSGRVFVGAGEEVTSEGMQPECVRGGSFLELAPGPYTLRVSRLGPAVIALSLQRSPTQGQNFLRDFLRLP